VANIVGVKNLTSPKGRVTAPLMVIGVPSLVLASILERIEFTFSIICAGLFLSKGLGFWDCLANDEKRGFEFIDHMDSGRRTYNIVVKVRVGFLNNRGPCRRGRFVWGNRF
jgi:hypothetical protein